MVAATLHRPGCAGALGEITDEQRWDRARSLQKVLYDGGFAGLCYPSAYGGQGLQSSIKRIFGRSLRYEMPILLNIPRCRSACPQSSTLGRHTAQTFMSKRCFRARKSVEFLSEPQSGSDLAGGLRADWNGTHWIINNGRSGPRTRTSATTRYAPRTHGWDARKHQGLTMFLVPLRHPA
jgi:alkylation response protein AidB-like acyl-CoA dehydrogenase